MVEKLIAKKKTAKSGSNWHTGLGIKDKNVKVFGPQLRMPSDQMVIAHMTLNGSSELKTEMQVMTSISMWNVQLVNGSTLSLISSLKTVKILSKTTTNH